MSPQILIFAAFTALISLTVALAYRSIWTKLQSSGRTPTGFGVFMPLACTAAAIVFQAPSSPIHALETVLMASLVYWLDDCVELSATLRMAVSMVTGAAAAAILLTGAERSPLWLLCGACIAAGILNVILTNIVNFYDGADLNLATLVFSTAGLIILFTPADNFLVPCAVAILAFVIPFAMLNSRPHTIYLGDAGSFAFASFLTLMIVIYLRGDQLSARVFIPLALPALDTFVVFCIRIVEKHDLMTRNYLHLYQRLNINYRGFGYLVPQIAGTAVTLVFSMALQAIGLSEFHSVAVAILCTTAPFYFIFRKLRLPYETLSGKPI